MSKMPTNIFDFEDARLEQVEDYAERREVLGLEDVERGVRVLFPTTIYNIKGDEVSGVAGLLYPNGDFIQTQPPAETALYWEFDETLRYIPTEEPRPALPHKQLAVGDSWTHGEVVWDGSVAGSINHSALAGDETDLLREVVRRRERNDSLTGEWASTGELYRAMERGTEMQNGPRPGRIHGVAITEDYGGWRQAS